MCGRVQDGSEPAAHFALQHPVQPLQLAYRERVRTDPPRVEGPPKDDFRAKDHELDQFEAARGSYLRAPESQDALAEVLHGSSIGCHERRIRKEREEAPA